MYAGLHITLWKISILTCADSAEVPDGEDPCGMGDVIEDLNPIKPKIIVAVARAIQASSLGNSHCSLPLSLGSTESCIERVLMK